MKLELTRCDEKKVNVAEMEKVLNNLLSFSKESFIFRNDDWFSNFSEILNFIDHDGSFKLINTCNIESEPRVMYCYYPSYYCTGIMMKALLTDKDLFTGKEDCFFPSALKFCCGRGLKGHGYDDLKQQIEIMDFFISCGLPDFIVKYPNFCPEFTEMINFIVSDYEKCIEKGKFVFYYGENHEEDFKRIVSAMTKKDDNLVWYVCYGSNLLEERFKTYIEGGFCKYNGRTYNGCNDKTLPKESKPVMLPYDMYLGNNSSSWDGSVSFLDITKKGKAYGRAYLVTKEQFDELWDTEGRGSNWYNKKVALDAIDGIPAFTFTNERILPFSSISYKYMYVLAMGLMETYPDMKNAETNRYLKSIIR